MFPKPLKKNDEIFISGATSQAKPFIRIYEQDTAEIVHGPSCRVINDEIFVDRCQKDNVQITERRGGGGTVILSQVILVIIIVGNKKNDRESATDIFRRIHGRLIIALCKAGIDDVTHAGVSDLSVNGKKILGSSLYMGPVGSISESPLFYYQSSLMVSNDISLMDRYLRHPPREPDYRSGRGHREFCATLRELNIHINISELSGLIESELRGLA
jgi:lipoate-protein ligase A